MVGSNWVLSKCADCTQGKFVGKFVSRKTKEDTCIGVHTMTVHVCMCTCDLKYVIYVHMHIGGHQKYS